MSYMRQKLNKADFEFLDKVGVGRIAIEELSFDNREYLKFCINRAVSILPFAEVEGMEEMAEQTVDPPADREQEIAPNEAYWDQNAVHCGNCSLEILARGGSYRPKDPRRPNVGLSDEEGEEEPLCGRCAGDELRRLATEGHP